MRKSEVGLFPLSITERHFKMKQLTVKDLKAFLKDLPDDTLVYLGDDDELNGIHCGWCIDTVDLTQADNEPFSPCNMIKERGVEPTREQNQTVLLIS